MTSLSLLAGRTVVFAFLEHLLYFCWRNSSSSSIMFTVNLLFRAPAASDHGLLLFRQSLLLFQPQLFHIQYLQTLLVYHQYLLLKH